MRLLGSGLTWLRGERIRPGAPDTHGAPPQHACNHAVAPDASALQWNLARAGVVREQGCGCASQDRQSMDSKQERQAAKKSESDEAQNDADDDHGGGLVRQSRPAAPPPPPRREGQDSRSLWILESGIERRVEDGAPVGRWRTYPSRMEELVRSRPTRGRRRSSASPTRI